MTTSSKKFVNEITDREKNFAQWYTDVIRKTKLVDYSPVKGFMVIRPYGYEIWEGIQLYVNEKLKKTGHKNCYFPLLIPESLLNKEKEHVNGFSPEVAWVTHGGDNELSERLCIRPTSEAIVCSMYAKWLSSYRDLPYLYNQWCSVVRWEKTTRPFLRTSEFLWQEGHTLHQTEEEACEEALLILDIYKKMAADLLAIPMVVGEKSEREKFAGAKSTYTMEALMYDGKALQSGTTHHLAQNFSNAFNITYQAKSGELKNPYQTSWGISTRLIGALIMVHGDNRGLVLPPKVAPIQVVIVPIAQKKPKVLTKATYVYNKIKEKGNRVKLDSDINTSSGWKFNEYEMKGIPLRVEVGPRDIEKNVVQVVRRDNLEKITVSIDSIEDRIPLLLQEVQESMFNKAQDNLHHKTFTFNNYQDFKSKIDSSGGFGKGMWCGDKSCEEKIKENTSATIRCIPFEQEDLGKYCHFCGKKAKCMVYLAKSY
ncbi:proline--tRNA ligase [Clostridium sp. 'deep sea']|uniref:proline--tRNA ligase n=1 Tax=Clostridium sp. 'deep sea' TaxID=2779445 RepID=UPI001896501D|nr:proline--tRNA ligase [Clostridium sp. 'deep sea']QOR35881.1 proline--tRNA ligase [Clostridium sp. 'deep sea']